MKAILHCLLLSLLALASVSAEASAARKPHESTTTAEGELDKDGRLMFMKGRPNVTLRKGQAYGMMVFYNESAADPRPSYRVFEQGTRKIVHTESFADFAAELDGIPAGSKVYLFDFCTAGSHYGMPEKFMDEVRAALKKRKLILAAPGYVICTCPR